MEACIAAAETNKAPHQQQQQGGEDGVAGGVRAGVVVLEEDGEAGDEVRQQQQEQQGGGDAGPSTSSGTGGFGSKGAGLHSSSSTSLANSRLFLVQRPRLLVCGGEGCGQEHMGPALLHVLEGLPVQSIGLPSLLADAGAR